ncbi:MAG: HlyD family efflux transporter periplasmic adaptor subunit [Planctomycetota bacterium]
MTDLRRWCRCLGVAALAALAGCGRGAEVRTVTARRGEIRETFTELARTRLARTFVVRMPIDGRIARFKLSPGDRVQAGDELVAFDREPLERALEEAQRAAQELEAQITLKEDNRLESIAMEEANAAVAAAEEALKASDAQVEAEAARHEHAHKEQERSTVLYQAGKVSQSEQEEKALTAETALIELRQQEFVRAALRALIVAVKLYPKAVAEYVKRKTLERQVIVEQLFQARARLAGAEYQLRLAEVRAPISGVVLEKLEQGDGPVAAGTPLVVLGDLSELEAESEVLTQDAMLLAPGSKVELRAGRGDGRIGGTVKRIEPAGFTKLSSLGVEQQRVRVIIAPADGQGGLGVGYHLEATFITRSKQDALIVPRYSVLQSEDGTYYVLRVVDGRLARQPVELGLKGDLELEVAEGLAERDVIVANPDTTMGEGERVRAEAQEKG